MYKSKSFIWQVSEVCLLSVLWSHLLLLPFTFSLPAKPDVLSLIERVRHAPGWDFNTYVSLAWDVLPSEILLFIHFFISVIYNPITTTLWIWPKWCTENPWTPDATHPFPPDQAYPTLLHTHTHSLSFFLALFLSQSKHFKEKGKIFCSDLIAV